jgi:hypothetical protein
VKKWRKIVSDKCCKEEEISYVQNTFAIHFNSVGGNWLNVNIRDKLCYACISLPLVVVK